MTRLPLVIAATLTVPVLAGLSTPAHAGPPLCNALPATIVGTPEAGLTGTAGADVIVTNGAHSVQALGGDDTICLTGETAPWVVSVYAGTGDDRVETTAISWESTVDLGRGSDTFVGGSGGDSVDAGPWHHDDETDSISTGAGTDSVGTGAYGKRDHDDVDLGDDSDVVHLSGLPGNGLVDGGTGSDQVQMYDTTKRSWLINNRRGLYAIGPYPSALAGMELFRISDLRWSDLNFIGGEGNEVLDVSKEYLLHEKDGRVVARLGGGDDELVIRQDQTGPFSGGAGTDELTLEGYAGDFPDRGSATVDLRSGRFRVAGEAAGSTRQFEDVTLDHFNRNAVIGDNGDNQLVVFGCRSSIQGGGGADRMRHSLSRATTCPGPVRTWATRILGGAGRDRLVGGSGNDYLVGGPGHDGAYGARGRDRCVAELRVRCEAG
jgi:Ca2+-binding RTX toxin-like protein